MEVESVILLGLKMWMCLVCIRDCGMGGMWRDPLRVYYLFIFCMFVVLVLCFCFVFPLFLWLRNQVRPVRVIAPRFFMS